MILSNTACNNNNSHEGFDLKIKIKGKLGSFAILHYQSVTGDKIDSAFVNSKDVIRFRGNFSQPQLVLLEFPDIHKKTSLFLENKNISITADINTLPDLEVDGTELHNQYRKMLSYISAALDSANHYDSLYIISSNPEYELKYNIFKNIEQTNIRKFIASNRTSPVSLFALINNFTNAPSYVEINNLYESLDSNLKQSTYGRYFYNDILLPSKRTAIGMQAPDFKFKPASGDSTNLSDLQGKYVLLNFWASWSLPCRQFNDELQMISAAYANRGLIILQVSIERNTNNWRKAIEEQGLHWINYSDGLAYESPIAKLYGVKSIPYTLLIDDNGEIIAKNMRGQMLQYQCWRIFGDL
jgi:thiol-disulfide isomerase/thioredoxin